LFKPIIRLESEITNKLYKEPLSKDDIRADASLALANLAEDLYKKTLLGKHNYAPRDLWYEDRNKLYLIQHNPEEVYLLLKKYYGESV